ncbi:ThyX-like thymidylate synthase [Mycobacterium phage Bachome]|nr:ThyX-like thymidylate synthase [Mycobacterium phage Bachome]UXE05095.1 ThyX-like thymidylate synthase [Mycobacterium phage MaCh]
MKVQLIAHTSIEEEALEVLGYEPNRDENDWVTEKDADELAEFAGRNCYRSFHRPNPKTRTNVDYLDHILEVGHESVLEHSSATFYIEASRSVLTELERHRHLSFSVVSQRYVDATKLGRHIPPAVDALPEIAQPHVLGILAKAHADALDAYEELVKAFSAEGLPRKQAREAARAVLPNMTNSPMVVTGNHRAWRYVIKQRWHTAADAEIRQLAGELLKQLRKIAPNTYQDIPNIPYS